MILEEISPPAHHSIAGSFSAFWNISQRSTCEPCQITGMYAGSGGRLGGTHQLNMSDWVEWGVPSNGKSF